MKGSLLLSILLMLSNDPDRLPCREVTITCIDRLTEAAVESRREIAVLQQAIEFQKRKLWTTWMTADAANPVSMGLRVIRNLAGGGDRAAMKLEIARLELRKAELMTTLRENISKKLTEFSQSESEVVAVDERLRLHHLKTQIAETRYAAGEDSTRNMIEIWLQERELVLQRKRAAWKLVDAQQELESLVYGHREGN